ncbi:MAG: CotH kinase family protein [Oscillospiraceae bacterium]|nr:CotH kinase family protein [Oscillospiraceae bacterium]
MKKKIISLILLTAMILSQTLYLCSNTSSGGNQQGGNKSDTGKTPSKSGGDSDDDDDDSSEYGKGKVPIFSHEAGFYNQAFTLTLTLPEDFAGGEIYYTTSDDSTGTSFPRSQLSRHDGGVKPTESATLYTSPINVTVPNEVNVFTVSAVAVLNGEVSEPSTQSYIRGTSVNSRFGEDYMVISLYSDAESLFGYNDGILVPGLDRDEWEQEFMRINGKKPDPWRWDDELPPTAPANFNRKGRGSEREVNIEVFDSKGVRHLSQRAGMRVKGGWSRGTFPFEQKSLEFYARNSYGDSGSFEFPLFGEQNKSDGSLLNKYKRFRIRNGGSDREQTYMRDELSHELFKQAGVKDVQLHCPAVIYLNGEYYGFSFIKTPRTENHLSRLYGGDEDNFTLIGSNERGRVGCETVGCGRVIAGLGVTGGRTPAANPVKCGGKTLCGRDDCESYWSELDDGCKEFGECRGVKDWEEIRKMVYGSGGEEDPNGLDDDAVFAAFCERVDIDNLIQYYALEMYIANVDWPANNVELWRYFPSDQEKADRSLPKELDGKWRFYCQDLEFGYGLWSADDTIGARSGTRPTDNTLHAVINKTGVTGGGGHFNANHQTYMIPALVRRADMRARLANAFADIVEGAYEPRNAVAVFEKLQKQIESEHKIALNGNSRRITEIDRDDNNGSWPDWNAVEMSHRQIRDFLEQRPAAIADQIESELGFRKADKTALTFKNGLGGTAVMNTRPVGESETVTGNYYSRTSVSVTAQPFDGYFVDYWLVDGQRINGESSVTVDLASPVSVEVNYARDPDFASLVISEIGADYVEICNYSVSEKSVNGLYLSNSKSSLQKYAIADGEISPDGKIKVEDLGFKLKLGKKLYLSDSDGEILYQVELSRVNSGYIQSLGRDGKWSLRKDSAYVPPTPTQPTNPDIPDNPTNPTNPTNPINPNQPTNPTNSGSVTTTGAVSASYVNGSNTLTISNIPESGEWTVSVPVDVWPPSGGPWGVPDGVSVSYSGGVLTFSGNGRHGWGDNWNVNWGYW